MELGVIILNKLSRTQERQKIASFSHKQNLHLNMQIIHILNICGNIVMYMYIQQSERIR